MDTQTSATVKPNIEAQPGHRFCWEVYPSSSCETCKHFIAYQQGALDLAKVREIVLIDETH